MDAKHILALVLGVAFNFQAEAANAISKEAPKKNQTVAKKEKPTKVTICHVPRGNPKNVHTITVSASALKAHLAHNDYLGECKQSPPTEALKAPSISFDGPTVGFIGQELSIIPTNAGGVIASCTSTPALPEGLSISNTCKISGTPTKEIPTKIFSITASNAKGSSTAQLSLTVQAAWIYLSGSKERNYLGNYAEGNHPPGLAWSVSWSSDRGDFYLFSGGGYDAQGKYGDLNQLWMYSDGQWNWLDGSNLKNQPSNYGVRNVPAESNYPSSRELAMVWKDQRGDVYILGGGGISNTGEWGLLQDLWRYDGTNFTWINGSQKRDQLTYCPFGAGSICSIGGRMDAMAWVGTDNNLYLFGGFSFHQSNPSIPQYDNNLFKYDGRSWILVKGSGLERQPGIYGLKGSPREVNIPGARVGGSTWFDPRTGTAFIFAGQGRDINGTDGFLNDLWKYENGMWVWLSGARVVNQVANYGTKSVAAATNIPGARYGAVEYFDEKNNRLCLLGGYGYSGTNTLGRLNDMWCYSLTDQMWTWIGGSNSLNVPEVFGTLGEPSLTSYPGARDSSVSWFVDGIFYVFGGMGHDVNGRLGYLSSFWSFQK